MTVSFPFMCFNLLVISEKNVAILEPFEEKMQQRGAQMIQK